MEGLGFWILLIGGYLFFKGFGGNSSQEDINIEPLQFRLVDDKIGGQEVKVLQAKGTIPYYQSYPTSSLKFVTLLNDITGDIDNDLEFNPIASMLEQFQRKGQISFEVTAPMGKVSLGTYFTDWAPIATIPLAILIPPKRGNRKIAPVVIVMDGEKSLWTNLDNPEKYFVYEFSGSGYQEFDEDRKEITETTLKLGIAVAMSDGSLDDKEGFVIKEWIEKSLLIYDDEDEKKELKKKLNKTFKDTHQQIKDGKISLSPLTKKLNDIGDTRGKYSAIELCYDVMAADGVIQKEEMNMIDKVSLSLDLDPDELSNIRDIRTKNIDTAGLNDVDIEKYLKIDTDQPKEEIRKQLNKEFSKWNSRLNSLSEGSERDNAQRIINLISEARKKYK